jgi:pimeloyl-ACP methyl ester carboxylesterase
VGLLAAARLGESVEGVVCVDALHDADYTWPDEKARARIANMAADYEGTMRAGVLAMVPGNAELAGWIAEQGLGGDREAMIAVIPEFQTFDLARALQAVDVPIRCVNAADYGEYAMITAVETNRRHADFDAIIMHDVGHYLHLERPQEFNRRMRELLAEMGGPTP